MLPAMKWLIPLLCLAAFLPLRSSADTTLGTVINSLPYTITKGGVYYLSRNINYEALSGTAISINTDNVVIDLNHYQLTALSGSNNTAVGFGCSLGYGPITIKNGAIAGFQTGIALVANRATVTDMQVTNNYASGIAILGPHAQIFRNRVYNTGGTSTTTTAVGIRLSGTNGTVSDNDVQSTFTADATGHIGYGIRLISCAGIVVSNNRVIDVEPAAPASGGASTGISTVTSTNLIFLGNTALTAQTGFDLSGVTTGKYGDNTTNNVTTPYIPGSMTDIGNNN
jgi:hypothetical protein